MNKVLKFANRNYFNFFNKQIKYLFTEKGQSVSKADEKVPTFKPFEQMTLGEKFKLFKRSQNETMDTYGSYKRAVESKTFNKTEFDAKLLRQKWLRSGDVYHSHKHIIPVKRIRTKEDTIFKLLKQGEIACVLEGREEFDEIHFVVDKNYIKHLDRLYIINIVSPYHTQEQCILV